MRRQQRRRRAGLRRKALRGKGVYRRPAALSGVHFFKETCSLPPLIGLPNGVGSGVLTFKFDDLTNNASFTNLFDLFKITGVKLKLIPQYNVSDPSQLGGGASDTALPMLYIAENRDPWVPSPTSVGDILNDDGCKIIRGGRIANMYLRNPKPKVVQTNPDGSQQIEFPVQLNSSSKALQFWIPTGGNGQVKDGTNWAHYGYRWYIDNTQNKNTTFYNVYATYYFSMKEQD